MTSDEDITNGDLFLYALYRLGGAGKYVDVEDVFMEMWALAPARFSWRKYRQPNYKIMSKSIVTIRLRGDGDLLLGRGNRRQLTAQGVEWVTARLKQFDRLAAGLETAPPDRRPSQRVVAELAKSAIVRAFLATRSVDLARAEVAVLLRCAPDAPRQVWRERLGTLKSAARDGARSDLLAFLDYVEREYPEWFERTGNERTA